MNPNKRKGGDKAQKQTKKVKKGDKASGNKGIIAATRWLTQDLISELIGLVGNPDFRQHVKEEEPAVVVSHLRFYTEFLRAVFLCLGSRPLFSPTLKRPSFLFTEKMMCKCEKMKRLRILMNSPLRNSTKRSRRTIAQLKYSMWTDFLPK